MDSIKPYINPESEMRFYPSPWSWVELVDRIKSEFMQGKVNAKDKG